MRDKRASASAAGDGDRAASASPLPSTPPKFRYVNSVHAAVGPGETALVAAPFSGKKLDAFPNDVLCSLAGGGVDGAGGARGGYTLLGDNNLITEVPPEACTPLLYMLDLGCNRVTALAGALAAARNLTLLDLRNNRIESIEPGALASLRKLTYLNLRNNRLEALPPLPPSLEVLQCGENKIAALRSSFGAELPSLRSLTLSGNRLRSLPKSIAAMRSLEEFDLRSNAIAALPPQVGGLRQLRRLVLYSNKIEHVPRELGGLGKLEHLDLLQNSPFLEEDTVYRTLLRLGTQPAVRELKKELFWAPFLHDKGCPQLRDGVMVALLSAHRGHVRGGLPRLPPEVWVEVFEMLRLGTWERPAREPRGNFAPSQAGEPASVPRWEESHGMTWTSATSLVGGYIEGFFRGHD